MYKRQSERRDQDVAQVQPVLEDQLLSIARSQVEGSVARYNRGVRWEAEHLSVHGTRWVSMYPVSYTHLDVYKRQEATFVCRFCCPYIPPRFL